MTVILPLSDKPLHDHRFRNFLILSKFSMRFFSRRRARLYEQYTPKALIGLRGYLILKGLEFLFLQDPIQIRFVLLKLITKPESSLKVSNK